MARWCLVLLALVCCYGYVSGEDPEVNFDAVSYLSAMYFYSVAKELPMATDKSRKRSWSAVAQPRSPTAWEEATMQWLGCTNHSSTLFSSLT